MIFDSSTLCARTAAGAAELAKPSQGLSLGQRRVLNLLHDPSAVDELAQKHHLEPEKLARDLTRLAELHLVELHGPTIPAPRPPPPAPASMTPVVIGRSARRFPATLLAAGAAALVLVAGVWYGTRSHEAVPANPPLAAAAPDVSAVAPAVSPPAPAARSAPDAVPGVATVLRGNALPAAVRPEIRPGLLPAAAIANAPAPVLANPPPLVSANTAAAAPKVPEPRPDAPPRAVPSATSAAAAPVATPAPAPAPAPPPTQVNGPAAATNAIADAPPVQIAAALPATAPARPAIATELKAITRDAPDFPREAIAAGVKSGVVTARIHVDPSGKVTTVDILAGQPPRIFDRAVRNALSRWQFEPIAAGRSSDVEINFQRE